MPPPAYDPVTDEQIQETLAELPGSRRDGIWLRGNWRFPAFAAAVAFTQRVAEVADELDHHPEWTVRYRNVDLATSTHDTGGLTNLDLDLSRRIADIAATCGGQHVDPE